MSKRGRHTSLCSSSDRTIKRLESSPFITKIILGKSENCRHKYSPGTLKIQREENAGFKVNCYGGNGVTTIYIYCDEIHKDTVINLIKSS
jgi:hypothetical protein